MSNIEGTTTTADMNDVASSFEKLDCDDQELSEDEDEKETKKKPEDYVDEVLIKETDESCTPEQLTERKDEASKRKEKGNTFFKETKYDEARLEYTCALQCCPLPYKEERAILFSNRAACKMKQELNKEALEDCTKAIELNPVYVKALLRRAMIYESLDKLDEAAEDYKEIIKLDSCNKNASESYQRLHYQIEERNEKMKKEMMSSLKELGNKLLKPFGLSTENFQLQQDPNSGGYSINFNQNKK